LLNFEIDLAKKLQGKKFLVKKEEENYIINTKDQDYFINYNKSELLKNKP